MWELIAANQRKSLFLFAGLAAVLTGLGAAIGAGVYPQSPVEGAMAGGAIAAAVWVILAALSFYSGDSILLAANGAREVTPDIDPRLFNVVEEMKIAANLPGMPRVYVIDDPSPNAFATGIRADKSAVAVTAGLLDRMSRDELQGVVAHEVSHIMNRDVIYMTYAGVMLGSVQLISEVFLRGLWHSGGSSRRFRAGRGKSGGGQGLVIAVALVAAILGPILARIFYFSLSRRREYLADACGARLTRYPEGLASALEKIAASSEAPLSSASSVTAPMYISNPFLKADTHPPIAERIAILRRMGQGAGFRDYQTAFSSVKGAKTVLPPSALGQDETLPVREPHREPEKPKEDPKTRARGVGDLMRAVNGFAFLACTCGLKVKLPPGEASVICPRCARPLQVPSAILASAAAAAGAAGQSWQTKEFRYERKTDGWETFGCACGKLLQISPAFIGNQVRCAACGRRTQIAAGEAVP